MARVKNNIITQGISGKIGKQLVYKTYGDKTVITQYPRMHKVKFTDRQKAGQSLFARAVEYAHSINKDPAKKAAFQATIEPGRIVFNAAISAYITEHKKGQG